MRKTVLLLASMALAVLLVSGVALAQPSPGEVSDATCPTNSGLPNLTAFFRSSAIEAQTFTAEHTGLLTSAQAQVRGDVNQPTDIVMEIRTVDASGTPTGVVLASTTIPAFDVPYEQYGVVTGHFNPGAQVEAGQQYAIALHTSTEVQGNGPSWQGSTSNPCPGVLYNTDEGHPGVFQAPFQQNADAFFSTFVTLRTAPQTKADCKKGGYREFGFKNQGQCIKAVKNQTA